MSLLDKLFAAAKAVNQGESLKDPATWKNRTILMNVFLSFLALIPMFAKIDISQSDMNAIAYGFVTIAGVANTYMTAATSDKVGIGKKK